MASEDPGDQVDFQSFWPRVEPTPPSQWTVPLTMVAIGKIVAIESLDRDSQVFRYQNCVGQMQVDISPPSWLTENFPGMLDKLPNDKFGLDISRFHLGSTLAVDEWEDQLFQIICEPHFNFIPCGLSFDNISYKRLAWIHDDSITPVAERFSMNFPNRCPVTPPFVTFNGFVDTQKFPLAENPAIGLDEVTRNSSAVFKIWSKFPSVDNAVTPKAGWCGNYVYAMLPKCKKHLEKKCRDYKAGTTPFRKHGKKAFVVGYFHGFCDKNAALTSDYPYNPFEFLPLIEIVKIDWAAGEPRGQTAWRDEPMTPTKNKTPSMGKKGFAFDPVAQMISDGRHPSTPSKSGSQSSSTIVLASDPLSVDVLQEALIAGAKRAGDMDSVEDSSDGPSPTKRSKQGSLRGRKRAS